MSEPMTDDELNEAKSEAPKLTEGTVSIGPWRPAWKVRASAGDVKKFLA